MLLEALLDFVLPHLGLVGQPLNEVLGAQRGALVELLAHLANGLLKLQQVLKALTVARGLVAGGHLHGLHANLVDVGAAAQADDALNHAVIGALVGRIQFPEVLVILEEGGTLGDVVGVVRIKLRRTKDDG